MQRSLLNYFSAPATAEKNLSLAKSPEKTPSNSTGASDVGDKSTPKSVKIVKQMNERWFSLFPWLEANEERTLMFCKTCRDANFNSKFATTGASNCQLSTVRKHNESREHKEAERIVDLRTNRATQLLTGHVSDDGSDQGSDDDDDRPDSGAVKLFKIVYCAAKSHFPNDSVNDLLEMSRFTANDIPFRDLSTTSVLQI